MSQGETGKTGAKGEAGAEGVAGVAGAAGAEGAVGRTGLQGEAGPAALLDPAVAAEIKRSLRTLVIATVVLYVALVGVVVWTYIDSANRRDSIAEVAVDTKKNLFTINEALCAIRHDSQVDVAAGKAFLKKNPEGIPGISAALIQEGIDNSQATVDSLDILKCPLT